ncbi:unnamed protein product [Gongylonema pulchrum]|uniref:Fam-a protein n=1 Tax=Gongylonema pulchrum TaxID=637853 RepID=A0A183EWI8_9BILA|nr:unnamed protein product [Gongylonema pulchrum]
MSGIYTHKIYRIKSKVPATSRKVLPDGAFILHEKCWNAYPYCKTIITNPDYMGENFHIKIESTHINDHGETENALNLKGDLKDREVIIIDIYDDKYLKESDITVENDVRKFKSKKTNRGPLVKDWYKNTEPVMCCYKVEILPSHVN